MSMYAQEPTFDPEDCIVLSEIWHRWLRRSVERIETEWGWNLEMGSRTQAQMIHGTFHDYWISHFTKYASVKPDQRPIHQDLSTSRASVVVPFGRFLGSLILVLPEGKPDDWEDHLGLPKRPVSDGLGESLPFMTELALRLSQSSLQGFLRWGGLRVRCERERIMCFHSQGYENKVHRMKDAFLLLRTPFYTSAGLQFDVLMILKLAECWTIQTSLRRTMSCMGEWDSANEAEVLLQMLLEYQ